MSSSDLPKLRIVQTSESEPSVGSNSKSLFTTVTRTSGVLAKRELNAPRARLEVASLPSAPCGPAAAEPLPETLAQAGDDKPFTLSWAPLPSDLDARILEAICASPSDGRSAYVAFREREVQLGTLFAALSVADAQLLHRRLTIPAKDDPVAAAFARINSERRGRLLQFLADARRRAAHARARR